MRTPATLAALAAAFTLGASPAVAEDGPTRLELKVGEEAVVGGASGKCDDPAVATITLGAQAIVTGVRPGTTTCSARVGGFLRVYQVTVRAPGEGERR